MGNGNIEGPKTTENPEVKVNAGENTELIKKEPTSPTAGEKPVDKVKEAKDKQLLDENKELLSKEIFDVVIDKDEKTWDKFDTYFNVQDKETLKNNMKEAIKNKTDIIPPKASSKEDPKPRRTEWLTNVMKVEKSHINREHVFEEFTKIIPNYDEKKDGDDLKNLLRMTSKEYPNRPKEEYPPANQIMFMLKSGKYDANMIKEEILKNVRDAFDSNGRNKIPKINVVEKIPGEQPEQINNYVKNSFGTDKGTDIDIYKTFSKYNKESYNFTESSSFDNTIKGIKDKKPIPGIIPKGINVVVPERIASDKMFNNTINKRTIKDKNIKIVPRPDVREPYIEELRDKIETTKKSEKIMFENFEPNVIDNAATKIVGDKINNLTKNPDEFTKRKIDSAVITGSASHNPTEYKPKYNNIVLPKNTVLNDATPDIGSPNNKDLSKDRALEIYSKLPQGTNATINYGVFGPTPDDPKIIGAKNEEEKLAIYKEFQNSTLNITYTDTSTKPGSEIYDKAFGPKTLSKPYYNIGMISLNYQDKPLDNILKKDQKIVKKLSSLAE